MDPPETEAPAKCRYCGTSEVFTIGSLDPMFRAFSCGTNHSHVCGWTQGEKCSEYCLPLTPEQLIAELQAKLDEAQAELSDRRKSDAMIAEQSAAVEKQAMTVLSAESALKQAKGLRDSQKEKYDGLVNELRSMLRDASNGQKRLDFDGDGQALQAEHGTAGDAGDAGATVPPPQDPAKTAPITELGTKFVKNLIGGEDFARRKEIEEPVGLTDKQLDDLAGTELHTISDLEGKMKANQFWAKDSGLGEKTADRVINTLLVWRQYHPHVEQAEGQQVPAAESSDADSDADSEDENDENDGDDGEE